VLFGVMLFWLDQRIKHWLLVPVFIAATIWLFFLVLVATGTVRRQGFLHQSRLKLRESLAHLVGFIVRSAAPRRVFAALMCYF
jgi:hypothetical protein